MDPNPDHELARIAETQHGVFGRVLLSELGFGRRQRQLREEQGRWVRVFEGVYRMAGVPETWRGRLLAACLAGGADAVASHRSAAALWGIGGGDDRIQELMCRRWRRPHHRGVVVHETKALAPADVAVVDRVPVTSVERTILDLGAVRSPQTVERAMESALRKEFTTLAGLRTTVRRLGRPGRNGVGVLRRLLDERDPDRRLTESEMEMLMVQVLRRNGLREPVLQHDIWHHGRFIARVDAAYVDSRLALEYESFEWHTGKEALIRDSTRRNAIVGADWLPISVTWEDLRSGGVQVCSEVIRAMHRAA